MSRFIYKVAGVVFAATVFACTPGAATDTLVDTPDVPDGDKCDAKTIGGVISPYVLEWPTSTRGDLEAAMGSGVVVVSYSCDGVKVLPDCKVDGDYGYLALTPKTESNLIEGADNIRASFGGASFGVDAKMERGAKLDMSYMLVGKRSTQRNTVTKADLVGDDFCAGATHFVKRADVGAWTMVTGKNVTAGIAAKVMNQGVGAESSNKELRSKADGDPKTCKSAKKGDPDSPDGCGALILVSLAPIKSGEAKIADIKKTGVDDTFECPAGRVKAEGGGCVTKEAAKGAYLCEGSDVDECVAQCKAGSDGSCGRLANKAIYVDGENADDAQMQKTIELLTPLRPRFETACKNGSRAGVHGLGVHHAARAPKHRFGDARGACGQDVQDRLVHGARLRGRRSQGVLVLQARVRRGSRAVQGGRDRRDGQLHPRPRGGMPRRPSRPLRLPRLRADER